MDGLDIYGSEYLHIRFQPAILIKSAKLEINGRSLAKSSLSRTVFVEQRALLVGRFMLGVQNILAATSEVKNDFVPWTIQMSNKDFANLLWEFYQTPEDADKILLLAQCLDDWYEGKRHFSPASLRSVTTLARMLDPYHWGMMSWRVLGCLGFESMTQLKTRRLKSSPEAIQQEFAAVDCQEIVKAAAKMRKLRGPDLPTAASVGAALFCISLDLWPAELSFERESRPDALMPETCDSLSKFV